LWQARRADCLEEIVSLVRIERPELAAEQRLVIDDESGAPFHIVDEIEVAAPVRVPGEADVIVAEKRCRHDVVVARHEPRGRRGGRRGSQRLRGDWRRTYGEQARDAEHEPRKEG
jgi:hypothetical protein